MSKVDLAGRTAIVTGAGGGLGRTYAIDLAKHGAKVIVNDLGSSREGDGKDTQPAQKVVEEIIALGGKAVANFDSVVTGADKIIKTALDNFGTVDILVNNAGFVRDMAFVKINDEAWDSVVDVHLKGAFACIRAAWPVMREKQYGRIVNISSGSGLFGNFGQASYAAAKIAVVGLANVLKIEGAKNNIFINVVAPVAGTRLNKEVIPPEIFQKSKPELVAAMVTYLCSEQCKENGSIFNAGVGYFSRSAIMTGSGWYGGSNATAEDVMQNFDQIKSLEKLKYYNKIDEQLMELFKG